MKILHRDRECFFDILYSQYGLTGSDPSQDRYVFYFPIRYISLQAGALIVKYSQSPGLCGILFDQPFFLKLSDRHVLWKST